jgi:hypothetical protein
MTAELALSRAPYVSLAAIVIDHAPDERVRLRLGDAEDSFRSLVDAEVKSTNVDAGAPPNVPRLTMADNHKQLLISMNRIELQMQFESDFDANKAYDVARKYALKFMQAAAKFKELGDEARIGFVVHRNHPTDSPREGMATFLAQHLYGGASRGEISTLEVKIGFKRDDLYRNFGFSIYELKEFRTQVVPGRTIVNLDEIEAKELGIGVMLDINNRLRVEKKVSVPFLHTGEEMLNGMDDMLRTDLPALLPIGELR